MKLLTFILGIWVATFSMAFAQDNGHAALAIDRENGYYYGWASDQKSQEDARNRALAECVNKGGACSVVLHHSGSGCIAYRTIPEPTGSAYGWGRDHNKIKADLIAKKECLLRSDGRSCSNSVWACNSNNPVESEVRTFLKSENKTQHTENSSKKTVTKPTKRAVLFVIDKSGSMAGKKIFDAKLSAISAAQQALDRGVRVGILTFSGDCSARDIKRLQFTKDHNEVEAFVNAIEEGGGTPLSVALNEAANMLQIAGIPKASAVTVVLADGDDDCGGVDSAIIALKKQNYLNRHETVGLEVSAGSEAVDQLRKIAITSGGNYQPSAQSSQLEEILLKAVNSSLLLDLVGSFQAGDKSVLSRMNTPVGKTKTGIIVKSITGQQSSRPGDPAGVKPSSNNIRQRIKANSLDQSNNDYKPESLKFCGQDQEYWARRKRLREDTQNLLDINTKGMSFQEKAEITGKMNKLSDDFYQWDHQRKIACQRPKSETRVTPE